MTELKRRVFTNETSDFEPPTARIAVSRATSRSAATVIVGVAVLIAGCSVASNPGSALKSVPTSTAVTSDRRSLAAQYLSIAEAGNDRLEIDFDRLSGRDRDRLASSLSDLRDVSATERLFDRHLLTIAFPTAVKMIAEELYAVNESRAQLTAEAASSRTLGQVRDYELRLSTANESVEAQVRLIRSSLHLPPPMSS